MPIRLQTLIDKCQLLDPIADDDDIVWNTDPFEMRPDRVNPETPDAIIAMIKISGSPWLQEQLRSRCRELINIFSTGRPNGYRNRTKSEAPCNRLTPRHHSAEKQLAIRTQIIKLLELGVIKELQGNTYRRWSMAICPAQRCDTGP